jgi:hypothetical protein
MASRNDRRGPPTDSELDAELAKAIGEAQHRRNAEEGKRKGGAMASQSEADRMLREHAALEEQTENLEREHAEKLKARES